MIVLLVVLTIAIILESLGFKFKIITYGLIILCALGYIILFFIESSDDDKFLINPFGIIALCGTIPLGVFVTVFFFKQYNLITRSLTTKQLDSILKETFKDNNSQDKQFREFQYKARGKLTNKTRMENLKTFLKKSRPKSLFDN